MILSQIFLTIKHILLIITGLIIITIIYSIWDNNRIIVIQQEVQIENLPPEFENYKILLLSDLHGKRFGESQQYITRLINDLDYDVIVIAGDSQDNKTEGIVPLLELLHGIDRQTPIFYVAGNNGPFDSVVETGEILEDGQTLQTEGVSLMTLPVQIKKGEQHIWFVPYFSYQQAIGQEDLAQEGNETAQNGSESTFYERMLNHQAELRQAFEAINNEEVMICVTHEPLLPHRLDEPINIPVYDLVLAGHYHGGQYRLPFIGPIFLWGIPSEYHGFFPGDTFISGLYIGKSIQQYISRGLGASGFIPMQKFRLFNTPEINLIILTNMVHSD